ncbi:acylphosphatase [Fervidobacterium sp.]
MEVYGTIWKKWNVRGVVQGVGFRHFVKNVARAIGVKGYVKNEPDGSVTIVAGGNIEQIKELFRRFMEGNGWSYISDYDELDIPQQEYKDFHVEF